MAIKSVKTKDIPYSSLLSMKKSGKHKIIITEVHSSVFVWLVWNNFVLLFDKVHLKIKNSEEYFLFIVFT